MLSGQDQEDVIESWSPDAGVIDGQFRPKWVTMTMDWAGRPSGSPEFAFHEEMLDVLGQGDAQLFSGSVQAAGSGG